MVERAHGERTPRTLTHNKMKTNLPPAPRRHRAFTLVEMLTVMAVIAVLAAILFPAFGAFKKSATNKNTRAQLGKIVMAIEAYKAQHGHYPPDNQDNLSVNQLYYELVGTKLVNNNEYQTESGQGNIMTNTLPTFFSGTKVPGFVNVTRGGGDDVKLSKNYLICLKPTDYLLVNANGASGIVLGTTVNGPLMLTEATPGSRTINPWRYVSTGPSNNPGHFDLWVDVIIGGKTNRISNWNEKPQLVAY